MQNLSYNSYCLIKQKLLMASSDLPSSFEVIVIGTGLEESIIAAAAARNGHSVLHVDINDYYGSQWSAFTLDGITNWVQKQKETNTESSQEPDKNLEDFLKEGETLVPISKSYAGAFSNVEQKWFVPKGEELATTEDPKKDESSQCDTLDKEEREKTDCDIETNDVQKPQDGENSEPNTEKEAHNAISNEPKETKPGPKPGANRITQESVNSLSKRFSLDLFPHLLFSRGSMVELLIKSNISRYTEFKSVSRILTLLNGHLEHVPSSRSDVFSTKYISVIEKRILMKFINFCINSESQPEAFESFRGKTFLEFLRHQKLTDNLIHFVLYSIAMVDEKTGCPEGLASTKKFLSSLGRFGNSPLLWPMYGSGEMPQAFCRLCAVFGGVYYLDRPIDALVVNSGRVVAIVSKSQRIECEHAVVNSNLCPDALKGEHRKVVVSRKVCITSQSIVPADGDQVSFVCLSPKLTSSDHFVNVQEVGYSGAATPQGYFCLHLTSPGGRTSLEKSLDLLFKDRSNNLVWSLDFDVHSDEFRQAETSGSFPNLFLCSGPCFELDFDSAIERSETIFKTIFPGEDFLPRAPDPEEILIGDDDAEVEIDDVEDKIDDVDEIANVEIDEKEVEVTEQQNPTEQN